MYFLFPVFPRFSGLPYFVLLIYLPPPPHKNIPEKPEENQPGFGCLLGSTGAKLTYSVKWQYGRRKLKNRKYMVDNICEFTFKGTVSQEMCAS